MNLYYEQNYLHLDNASFVAELALLHLPLSASKLRWHYRQSPISGPTLTGCLLCLPSSFSGWHRRSLFGRSFLFVQNQRVRSCGLVTSAALVTVLSSCGRLGIPTAGIFLSLTSNLFAPLKSCLLLTLDTTLISFSSITVLQLVVSRQ